MASPARGTMLIFISSKLRMLELHYILTAKPQTSCPVQGAIICPNILEQLTGLYMREDRIVVYAKYPRPNEVKTRLARRTGADRASQLYSVCAEHVVREACR